MDEDELPKEVKRTIEGLSKAEIMIDEEFPDDDLLSESHRSTLSPTTPIIPWEGYLINRRWGTP